MIPFIRIDNDSRLLYAIAAEYNHYVAANKTTLADPANLGNIKIITAEQPALMKILTKLSRRD
jgi:hypothetical protein